MSPTNIQISNTSKSPVTADPRFAHNNTRLIKNVYNSSDYWIWYDGFETDKIAQYFEYDTGGGAFVREAGSGRGGGYAMKSSFAQGVSNAGNLKIAFGATPAAYFAPVDAGTANYRELYWRFYFRTQTGWTGGHGDKLTRAMVIADSSWSEAAIAHLWGADAVSTKLQLDPVRGTDVNGTLVTSGYNDFTNFTWLGAQAGNLTLFDAGHVGTWYCIECHWKLNDPGQSNGLFECWIDGTLDSQVSGLNFLGSFNTYGINSIFLENYWNAGASVAEVRYFDDFVISTQPIGP